MINPKKKTVRLNRREKRRKKKRERKEKENDHHTEDRMLKGRQHSLSKKNRAGRLGVGMGFMGR